MLKATYSRYFLAFKFPAKTSRATMRVKETFFVKVWDDAHPDVCGIGECALFRGLSHDDFADYERILAETCRYFHMVSVSRLPYSSLRFGFETAMRDLIAKSEHVAPAPIVPITINGLIWMGTAEEMIHRVEDKLSQGFRCLKLKIGGIDWESELGIIRAIRERFSPETLELRLDANEAFTPELAAERLEQLAPLAIHSIEQPIKRGQAKAMRQLIKSSPIPIALDEELIGVTTDGDKAKMLARIRPDYIILKPSLCGGLDEASRWIKIAENMGIGWWATSALESNVGLDAIARWVSDYKPTMPQGLGTGQLYRNNIPSPLRIEGERIYSNPDCGWDYSAIVWK